MADRKKQSKIFVRKEKKKAEIAKHQGRFKNRCYLLSRQLLFLSSMKITGEGNFFPFRARNNSQSCNEGQSEDLGKLWREDGEELSPIPWAGSEVSSLNPLLSKAGKFWIH